MLKVELVLLHTFVFGILKAMRNACRTQRKQTQQEVMFTQYTHKNEVAIEPSRKREQERSTSRTFVRLFVLGYKRERKSRRRQ